MLTPIVLITALLTVILTVVLGFPGFLIAVLNMVPVLFGYLWEGVKILGHVMDFLDFLGFVFDALKLIFDILSLLG